MMHCVEFDFREIDNLTDFYQKAILAFELPKWFGQNLDALWDVLTGEIALPVEVIFSHINQHQLTKFAEVITVFREAEHTLGGQLIFHCRASQSDPV
ncbi:barstar family protein [Arsenophonus apicola]|uniref:Barstar family protein n=1 Tax=Arsenophonus apicola TaxID=2879119 RepID=A0ABY8P1B9_9GAMM|nr:barstar family protein [Arsenophonus apicola]WGO83288.1 barstar family protein [Arsenophonus apicola]